MWLFPNTPALQVKELGAVLYNCSCVAGDLHRIFAMYRALGGQGASLPTVWPAYVSAQSSRSRPLKLQLNGSSAELYLSVSVHVGSVGAGSSS